MWWKHFVTSVGSYESNEIITYNIARANQNCLPMVVAKAKKAWSLVKQQMLYQVYNIFSL